MQHFYRQPLMKEFLVGRGIVSIDCACLVLLIIIVCNYFACIGEYLSWRHMRTLHHLHVHMRVGYIHTCRCTLK